MFCCDSIAILDVFLQLIQTLLDSFQLFSLSFCDSFGLSFSLFLVGAGFLFLVVVYEVVSLVFTETYSRGHYFYTIAFTTSLNSGMKNRFPKSWPYIKESWTIISTHVVISGIFHSLHAFQTWNTLKCGQKGLHGALHQIKHQVLRLTFVISPYPNYAFVFFCHSALAYRSDSDILLLVRF